MTFKRILGRALLPVLLLFCLAALPAANTNPAPPE